MLFWYAGCVILGGMVFLALYLICEKLDIL